MAEHTVKIFRDGLDQKPIEMSVATGMLISEAVIAAGIEIGEPCGGQGRCGRCIVQVKKGGVRRRSSLRLTNEDIDKGYALACQTVIEGDAEIFIPLQEKIERNLTTDRVVASVSVPDGYDFTYSQQMRIIDLDLVPPSMDDQRDDWSRLKTALKTCSGYNDVKCSLNFLKSIGNSLRSRDWKVRAIILDNDQSSGKQGLLLDLEDYGDHDQRKLYALAVDIGTTTVTVWLVDLVSGAIVAQASEYNGQISRGEDVISRIVYSNKENGAKELQEKVLETINSLIVKECKRISISSKVIYKAVIAGNSTMIHLLLGIPANSIRLSPFITGINQPPMISASELGLAINPNAIIDCLPGIASYVGSDITSGVLSSEMRLSESLSLFMDVGTNGEIVLGNQDWLVSCACSAGPAFEGAGVQDGMRATEGAIEEVWINSTNLEPSIRVIGGKKPKGICGSGLISLLAEMFLSGILDKAGNINTNINNPRIREGDRGGEYVVAWGKDTEKGNDIAITRVDIDNLLRAKAAIFAGFSVLAEQVGVQLESAEQILIGGSFGKYINIEKAIQIGLLPDVAWERFKFLGNTSVLGAYYALLNNKDRKQISDIADCMTYIELSADNTFYEAFMSAMFLPHTDLDRFPSVKAALIQK